MKGLQYERVPVIHAKPAGAYRLPRHVIRYLGRTASGKWDPAQAATIAHRMFGPGLSVVDDPCEEDDLQLPASTVAALGYGSIEAGRKVLQRWADMLRDNGAKSVPMRTSEVQPDGNHGRVR